MKKTLSSLRVEEETINNMKKAIEKHNKTSLAQLNENEFRRLAIHFLAQTILQDLPLPQLQ